MMMINNSRALLLTTSWSIIFVVFSLRQHVAAFIPGSHQKDAKIHAKTILRIRHQVGVTFQGFVSAKTSDLRLRGASDDDEEEGEDDDDHNGPLSKGIDSVSWLPSVIGAKGDNMALSSAKESTETLPLFPLGGFVYTPNTEHVLNIFEPRYRQMYTDILMNGSKRFVVVTSHPTEQGRFAQTGVLFELEDLKEVSEQTKDQIKYICNHKVTGRVTIHRVINPEAWEARNTYLKIEGTIHDDSGKSDGDDDNRSEAERAGNIYGAVMEAQTTKEENDLVQTFQKLVNLQHELEEDVRFTKAASKSLAVKDGPGEDGLWRTIRLWQSFIEQRLMSLQNDLQQEFQEKLKDFLKKEKGLKQDELPSAISFGDLSSGLQQELQELQKRMAVELQPLVLESSLTMQKILEARDHAARCKLLKYFMEAEVTRLTTKKCLQGLFASDSAQSTALADPSSAITQEERITDDNPGEVKKTGIAPKSPLFYDEPDAFQ